MSEGKRHTCIECKWYSEKGGPIGSCENTGYRLELEDFCRVPGNPMMIKGPKTWVPTWCHKFWKRMEDANNMGIPIKLTLSGAIKIGIVEGTIYPKEAREFLMEKKQSEDWMIYPIIKPISGKNNEPCPMIGNCDRAFNSMAILIWDPEDIVEYFVMDKNSSEQHTLESMFGMDVDGDMLYILQSNAVDDL